MFKSIARLGAFIAALGLSLSAAASTFSIDYSDLWGGGQPAPTEQGWGLNLIQQGDVIFGTMFVYGTDNTARWFSVTLNPTGGTTTWTGQLDQTTGSYYGTTWNNGSVTHSVVGNMSVTFSSASTGTLTYSVNGTSVTKAISRFSLRGPNLTGNYVGGGFGTGPQTGCGPRGISIFDQLVVTQNGAAVTLAVTFVNGANQEARCTYSGTMNTTGRTGSITGSFSCVTTSNNAQTNNGSFSITNLETSVNGFNGNFTSSDQFCTATGRFGGIKDVL
jgi:hypothetical protein